MRVSFLNFSTDFFDFGINFSSKDGSPICASDKRCDTAKSKHCALHLRRNYPDNCQDAFNVQPSYTDWAITQAFVIATDGLQNVIPPPFNGIATAAYVAAGEVALVLDTLNKIFERCQSDRDIAKIKDDLGNINSFQLDSFQQLALNQETIITQIGSTRQDILSARQTIVANDNTNTTNILNNANAGTTTITGVLTSTENNIVNNANANTTTLNTSITDSKTTIVNNDNSNAATLNTNLTNAKNTIVANDNANTTNIVNNDNANKTTIVNNDNANTTTLLNSGNANTLALNDLILRSQIEADLAAEPGAVKVAWYMTPTANGGKLDLVQQIVTLTLANIQAAGGSIGNAQSFLNQANADKAAGNFKSAYDNYRKAYKAAAN